MKMKKEIYLDHAATTPLAKEVLKEMIPYFSENYGNPGSFHQKGLTAKTAVDEAREKIASILNCSPEEIIFTSGGTEGDNRAVKGTAFARRGEGTHLITTKIEHKAILEPCRYLEKEFGFKTSYLSVDKYGLVTAEQVKKALTAETALVSVMYANNEIGTIEPIAEIGEMIEQENHQREKKGWPKVYFHTDACQAADHLTLDVKKLKVDMMTLNGGKIYGPKGIGLLYVRKGIKLHPLLHGGGQERGLRSGTEDVGGIVGLAKALDLAEQMKIKENARLVRLREKLISGIKKKIPHALLSGHATKRLSNNIHFCFPGIEGESLILHLNEKGIYAATGSACNSRELKPSYVLLALGISKEIVHSSLRLTLGRETTEKDIDYVLKVLPPIVEMLRKISPVKVKQ